MKTAHKIRINPTPDQTEYLKRACGTRRFIYNWGREQWEKQYQAYKEEQETVPEQGLPLVSFDQTLFLLWSCQEEDAAQTSHLSMSGLWADHG
jgi:transposase